MNNNSNNTNMQARLLPGQEKEVEFTNAFRASKVLIVTGPTGSGKTTVLTQYMLKLMPPKGYAKVLCTQPRRLAAIGAAKQTADSKGARSASVLGIMSETRIKKPTRRRCSSQRTVWRSII